MSEHPAIVHGRALALVAHYRAQDSEAYARLVSELSGPESVGATILSLVQWVNRALEDPTDNPYEWIGTALRELAIVEGDEQPPGHSA